MVAMVVMAVGLLFFWGGGVCGIPTFLRLMRWVMPVSTTKLKMRSSMYCTSRDSRYIFSMGLSAVGVGFG